MKTLFLASAALAAALALSRDQDPQQREAPFAFLPDTIYALQVKDVEASVQWYREVLGFELVLDLSQMGWCELTTPTDDALLGLGAPKPGEEPETNGGSSLSFGAEDIEDAVVALRKRGVEVGEIIEIPGIVKLVKFSDPDGNSLMLHQPLGEN